MRIKYLGHSGFLAETDQAIYIFDYIRGNIGSLDSNKPIYIFSSHSHIDHFLPICFENGLADRAEKYILSKDILRKFKRKAPAWLTEYEEKIIWVKRGETISLPNAEVRMLNSTDIGVAFAIYENGGNNIYHAGDLNWWHWEGEDPSWNRNIEVNYKREIDSLNGKHFDAAFVPLDPRLEAAYWYGLGYFLEKVSASHVFPMHFWKEYEIIPKYIAEHASDIPENTIIHDIHQEDETYEV